MTWSASLRYLTQLLTELNPSFESSSPNVILSLAKHADSMLTYFVIIGINKVARRWQLLEIFSSTIISASKRGQCASKELTTGEKLGCSRAEPWGKP